VAGGTACLIVEAVLKRVLSKNPLGASMWDQIRRSDVELARQKLAELRSTAIQRHAEELKSARCRQSRDRQIGAVGSGFRRKNGIERASSPGADQADIQVTPDDSDLLIAQNISPNFRRFSGRMASD
jgi:hypothetical protein